MTSKLMMALRLIFGVLKVKEFSEIQDYLRMLSAVPVNRNTILLFLRSPLNSW